MKKKWMHRICLALALMTALSCTACAQKEQPAAAFQPRLDTQAQVELQAAGFLGNFEALDQVINNFNEYYPNVAVHYESNGSDSLREYLTNNPQIDFFMTAQRNVRYPGWEERYVGDFCADLSQEDIDFSPYQEPVLEDCKVNGKLVRLPLGLSLNGMVVNKTLLEKEGLKLPTNYQEFLSMLESLKEKGYTPIQGASNAVYSYLIENMALYTLEEKNLVDALNQGESSAVDALRPVFERLNTILDKGYTDPAINDAYPEDNYDGAILRFFEGDVPFWICDTEKVSGMKKRESKSESFTANPFDYQFTLIPMGDEGAYAYVEPWYGFSLSKNSPNYDYALEFLRFLSTPEQLNTMASVKGIPTAGKDGSDARYKNVVETGKAGIFYSDGSVREHMKSFLTNAARSLADGTTATPRDAAQEYADSCAALRDE